MRIVLGIVIACISISCSVVQQKPVVETPALIEQKIVPEVPKTVVSKHYKHPKLWHPTGPVWECTNSNCYQN